MFPGFTKTAVLDLIERVVRTFVGVFVPLLITGGIFQPDNVLGELSTWQSASIAGLASAGSLVLGFILTVFGPRNGTTSVVSDVVDAEALKELQALNDRPLTDLDPGD